MNQRGQAILMFCIALSVLVLVLIGSIMTSMKNLTAGISLLRTRSQSYQATVQIAQTLQQAYLISLKPGGCSSSGLTTVSVAGHPLCLTSSSQSVCANMGMNLGGGQNEFRYCIAKSSGSLEISKADSLPQESTPSNWARLKLPLFEFSILPHAQAQVTNQFWKPDLSAAPTNTMNTIACAGATNPCAVCKSGATLGNAICFKVAVCLNNSENCPDPANRFETVVAVMTSKTNK